MPVKMNTIDIEDLIDGLDSLEGSILRSLEHHKTSLVYAKHNRND